MRRGTHEVDVFDPGIAEGDPPPPYMPDNGRFHGWDTALEQRAALMDALKKRNRA